MTTRREVDTVPVVHHAHCRLHDVALWSWQRRRSVECSGDLKWVTTVLQVVGGSESSSSLIYTRSQTAEVAAGGSRWGRGRPSPPQNVLPSFNIVNYKKLGLLLNNNLHKSILKKISNIQYLWFSLWAALAPSTLEIRYRARAGRGRVGDEKMNKKWQAVRRETPLWKACQLSVAGSLARLPAHGGCRWNTGVRPLGSPDTQPDLDSELWEVPLAGRSKLETQQ